MKDKDSQLIWESLQENSRSADNEAVFKQIQQMDAAKPRRREWEDISLSHMLHQVMTHEKELHPEVIDELKEKIYYILDYEGIPPVKSTNSNDIG